MKMEVLEKINIGTNVFVYPMPVTLVGAKVEGRTNFMAVGWLSRVNAKPPMLAVALNKMHYTPEGIKETRTFSVNFPSSDMVQETDYCGLVSGRRIDKSTVFDVFYGELETAPMIKACPLCLECKLVDIYELPTNNLFIGEIIAGYTEERFLTDDKPDIQKMNPLILTMPDNNYWTVGSHAGKAWSAGKKLKRTRQ
jgi:flavin reductase (DIM6/NTAB) family NADH-FMN oxidoreductase RutF